MKTVTKTIKMSYDNFEAAIVSFLASVGAIADNEEIISTDFGVEIDEDGMVEFDVEVLEMGRAN